MFLRKLGKISLSSSCLLALVAGYFALVLNYPFYRQLLTIHPFTGSSADYFLLTVPLFVFLVLNAVFQLIALPWLHRILIPTLLVLSAMVSYHEIFYGIYFDKEMLDNVLQTHTSEALHLITLPYILWVIVIGIVPAVLYCLVKVRYSRWWIEISKRIGLVLVSVLLIGLIGKGFYQDYASIVRNNKPIVHLILPSNIIGTSVKKIKSEYNANREFIQLGLNAKQAKPDHFRHVTIVVMGETTRAQNWGLNGYARQTTPLLAKRQDIVNFTDVSSCGTSTAYSVPCLFSHLPQKSFNNNQAPYQDNLLDILQRAGVKVTWLDNDAGCKGVCNRVENQDMTALNLAKYCKNGECLDEILFEDLDNILQQSQQDSLIVLHTMGSHGPTYYQRYPQQYRQFTPTCDTNEINQCSDQQLVNTYDNTILYVDYIVNKAIDYLAQQSEWESNLIYLSDHGESLGENGLYLHSAPYAIAPEQQTKVPMVMWFSEKWRANEKLSLDCLQQLAQSRPFSHDNFFHTVFGLLDMDLSLDLYQPQLDVVAQCKHKD